MEDMSPALPSIKQVAIAVAMSVDSIIARLRRNKTVYWGVTG